MSDPAWLGKYEVVRRLGSGDFAVVYEVSDGAARYAAKLVLSDAPAALERHEVERRALSVLDHSGIPRLVDVGVHDGRPFLVMALGKGPTLHAHIEARHALGAVHGEVEALVILTLLLDALAHVHEQGLVHRDIKDANVLCTESASSVTLLDFGFAKPAGERNMRTEDSFWRAGAGRFSPPAKLAQPALAAASHDVFAVGVIGYRLLTAAFPWSVTRAQDSGALRALMDDKPLVPVDELNNRISSEVARFIASLLCLADHDRPTAQEALATGTRLLSVLRQADRKSHRGRQKIAYPRVVRDPLHGDIRFTEYEWRVLAAPEMQRLRWLRQLGLANVVFPGAEHSRLAHALGTVARVEQVLRTIEDVNGTHVPDETRLVARLYALTHDVTHVPFGHTLEDELGFFKRHDEHTEREHRLVLGESSRLGGVLRGNEIGRVTLRQFDQDATVRASDTAYDLVSGVTGADVLDYVDRDALYCGLDHRIDSAIFRQFRLQRPSTSEPERLVSMLAGNHGLRVDREFAVDSVLRERLAMFLKVYTHPRKAAASAMLGKALALALFPARGRAELREEDIEWMSDVELLVRLAASRKQDVAAQIRFLMRRELPLAVYRTPLLPRDQQTDDAYRNRRRALDDLGLLHPRSRLRVEGELARAAGVEAARVAVYVPAKAPGYQKVEHWVSREPKNAPSREASPLAAAVAAKHLSLWDGWVFLLPGEAGQGPSTDVASRLADRAQVLFGTANGLGDDRRGDRLF